LNVNKLETTTLGKLFWNSVERNPDTTAQTWYEEGEWVSRPYRAFGDAVKGVGNGLMGTGLDKGDRVAIWSKNHPRWAEVDFANQSVGNVSVPIYDTLTGHQAVYILNNSGTKVAFIQDPEVLGRILPIMDEIASVHTFVLISGDSPAENVVTYEEFLANGQKYGKKEPKKFDERLASIGPDDLASLVYTSGTTGDPKGVMLTQNNFASNTQIAQTVVDVGPHDKFLSFLPLSHVFERTGGHFTAFHSGAQVVYARGIETLTEDMKIHSPTIMMSVPRLYEKIYGRIQDGVKKGSFIKRKIFAWAMAQGRAANVYRARQEPLPSSLAKKVARAEKLVFSKLHAAVGGKLRYFVSGGAALSQEIEEFFWAAGIRILQGYGLTETSPVTNVNSPKALRFGSVGVAVPETEIMIDVSAWNSAREDVQEGEICVKGPQVMKGYFNNETATKEVFDADGYFRTGDIGYVDQDGFLFITDRKKEIIVMSNGKNVAPQPIEGLLKLQPHIEQACMIGDSRKYMTCLIQPDFEALEAFAVANGIAATGAQLTADQRVISLFEQQVEAVNAQLPRYEQIKKFWVLPEAWGVETGELTPTMKLKRRIITDKFGDIITTFYPNE
jgi:long-chain acyl-CoA synthetase